MVELATAKTNGALSGCKLLKQLSQVLHRVINTQKQLFLLWQHVALEIVQRQFARAV